MSEENTRVYVVIETDTPRISTGVIVSTLSGNKYLIAHSDGTYADYPEEFVFFTLRMAEFHLRELLAKKCRLDAPLRQLVTISG